MTQNEKNSKKPLKPVIPVIEGTFKNVDKDVKTLYINSMGASKEVLGKNVLYYNDLLKETSQLVRSIVHHRDETNKALKSLRKESPSLNKKLNQIGGLYPLPELDSILKTKTGETYIFTGSGYIPILLPSSEVPPVQLVDSEGEEILELIVPITTDEASNE